MHHCKDFTILLYAQIWRVLHWVEVVWNYNYSSSLSPHYSLKVNLNWRPPYSLLNYSYSLKTPSPCATCKTQVTQRLKKLHRFSIRDCDINRMSEAGCKVTCELTYIIGQFVRHVQQNVQILEAISSICGAADTPIFQRVLSLQVYKNVELADSVWTCVCFYHANFYGHQQKRELLLRISVWNSTRNTNKFIKNMFVTQPLICDRCELILTASHVCFVQISDDCR